MNATAQAPTSATKKQSTAQARTGRTTQPITLNDVFADVDTIIIPKTIDDVYSELEKLIKIDISEPENVLKASAIFGRMLLFIFIISTAYLRPPRGTVEAMTRAQEYFNHRKARQNDRIAYAIATRHFSELQSCKSFLRERIESSILLLDAISAAKGNVGDDIFERANKSAFDTACYIGAYNVVMELEAAQLNIPELILAKKDNAVFLAAAYLCNKAAGKERIKIDRLESPLSPNKILEIATSNPSATLMSLILSATIDSSKEAKFV
jgi:hypothetical protein